MSGQLKYSGNTGKGRPKGVPNRASRALREKLESKNFDIAEEIITLYRDEKLTVASKVRLLEMIIQYTHPKLKEKEEADEIPETDGQHSEESTENLLAAVRG